MVLSEVKHTPEQQSVDSGMVDLSEMTPSLDVLVEIAFLLPKLKHCVRLAESLRLGKEFVQRVRAGAFAADTAALNILCKWRGDRSRRRTGRVLFDALVTIRQRDVAACFAGRLLGEELDNWEELCYDDEHRNFFAILQRQYVDVVAAHECMQCSEDFLNHLLHSGIVTHSEHEDLLHSSPALLRCDMNKKLLNIVNKKSAQLQEMFAALLQRYQSQLVTKDPEASSVFSDSAHITTGDAFANTRGQLKGDNLLVDLKDELRRWFNQLIITRPLDFFACGDFQPVSEIYVTLSSISYEEAVKLLGGPHQLHGNKLLKAGGQVAAESKHSKELLDLHSLLRFPKGIKAKSALLFGSAGSGKSMTVLKILSEWSNQNALSPFQQFDVILHITGRERSRLSTKEVLEFWQLWRMGYNEHQQRSIITHYAKHSEKVLLIIDAWDESGDDGFLQEDTVLKKILRCELFQHSSVIITSRPAPNAYPLLEDCTRRYSLVGFNNKRLRELFNQRLDKPQASRLFDTLSQSSHLHVKSAVQKTPLFAAMLVQLYKMEETLPVTITALYQAMLDGIRCRYVQWMKETQTGKKSDAIAFNDKPAKAEFDQVEAKLGKLALSGWMSSKVIFTNQEVGSCGKAAIQPQFGLLSEVKETGMYGSRVLYHFNHLTWQEYLAACSLAADPDFIKKLRICVSAIGVGQHTHLFWQFVAGLVNLHVLPDVVFELARASGISGTAPWETEIRLFLTDCVAESIRMKQFCSNQFVTNQYIQLAGQIISTHNGVLHLNACHLDAGRLSSLALLLHACPSIKALFIANSFMNDGCHAQPAAFCHLKMIEFASLSGQGASSFLTDFIGSLVGSSKISAVKCNDVAITRECLSAIAKLINSSNSLSEIVLSSVEIGLSGVAYLSRTIRHSSSLSKIHLQKMSLAGAGALLGEICARIPQLEELHIYRCSLDNIDMAGLLSGLQNSYSLKTLNVMQNVLTDEVAVPLQQYAVNRQILSRQVQSSFLMHLPELQIIMTGNHLSEVMLGNLADLLPANCGMLIAHGHLFVRDCEVLEIDHAAGLRRKLEESTDGHLKYDGAGVSNYGAAHVAQLLTTDCAHWLISLALRNDGIGDSGAAIIAGVVPKTQLQGLDLSNNQITIAGLQQLMMALSCDSALKYLNLSQNSLFPSAGVFADEQVPSILNLSLSARGLEVLSVSSTGFSDDDDVCFENSPLALMAIPSLSALDLSNNEITDKSIDMVTEWMDKLEYLSLSGNRISSAGGESLARKAQALTQIGYDQQNVCRLRRIWLGGNIIKESVFTDCSSEIISNDSLSLQDVYPRFVLSMFLSPETHSSSSKLPLHQMSGQYGCSAFWFKMNEVVQSAVFLDYVDYLRMNNQRASFDHWLGIWLQALAEGEDSSGQAKQAYSLINSFTALLKWYTLNEINIPVALAVLGYMLCVVEELMLTCRTTELKAQADFCIENLAKWCAQDSDLLCLAAQYLTAVAERCRQKQLHSVADKLLQRIEVVSQYAAMGIME